MRKRLDAWKVTCFRKIDIYRLHQLHRTAFSIVPFDMHFYLFKLFLRFSLASIFYFHNLLVLTKFGKCLGYTIIAIGHSDIKEWCTVWHDNFAGVYFCGLETIGFSWWEINLEPAKISRHTVHCKISMIAALWKTVTASLRKHFEFGFRMIQRIMQNSAEIRP